MENFIFYIVRTLMTCDSIKCNKSIVAGQCLWTLTFNGGVRITFDTDDIQVIRAVYEDNKYMINADDRNVFEHLFTLCC